MSSFGGATPHPLRRLGRAEFDRIFTLEFATGQVEQFLGSLGEIVAAVRRGPAHQMLGIEQDGALIGFAALHPDPRDAATWWLGWLAIDRRFQGGGRGGRTLAAVLDALRRVPGCREVRLFVCPQNAAALRLYRRAGFALHGFFRRTGELIMRCMLPPTRPSGAVPARFWANAILLQVIDARSCRLGVPVAAQLHGEVAHPP